MYSDNFLDFYHLNDNLLLIYPYFIKKVNLNRFKMIKKLKFDYFLLK